MEDVATSTAIALQADKLLFLTEVPGIREDPERSGSTIDTELALADAERLLAALPSPTQPPPTRPSTCSTASRPAAAASSAHTSCRSRWTARC